MQSYRAVNSHKQESAGAGPHRVQAGIFSRWRQDTSRYPYSGIQLPGTAAAQIPQGHELGIYHKTDWQIDGQFM